MAQKFVDVCICGAGIVGRALALMLARERLRVALVVPPAGAAVARTDVRAYALNAASARLLQELRVWPDEQQATAVRHMEVFGDGDSSVRFAADAHDLEALAWIVDVPALEQRLAQAVSYQPMIEVVSAPVPAPLTAICEGRASSTRQELGVEFDVQPYGQTALATRLLCERPHEQVARQWFSALGILAFLPLGGAQGQEVAVVWSAPPALAAQWQQAEAAEGARGDSWVLLGDAAHNVHPLAGQGLNLGLGDVRVLTQVIAQRESWRELGDERLLQRYARQRALPTLAMGQLTDGLLHLFASDAPLLRELRNRGLSLVNGLPPLKRLLTTLALDA